jgi:uncharacterized membrane protein YhaH (DUF805 family)
MEWFIVCMRKYADFSGRARRKEYWMFVLFNVIFAMLAALVDVVLANGSQNSPAGIFSGLYSLAVFLPGLAVTVRRLHDQDKSGWWYFIQMIPIIGGIWLFILLVTDGQPASNRFGPDPKVPLI